MTALQWTDSKGYTCESVCRLSDLQMAYEEGRKAERAEMRCETCKDHKLAKSKDHDDPCWVCYKFGIEMPARFGCIHHEPKEKSL